jgi:class III poly(R)-hydroxyalkanoic acid synthase PhaE subunit
MTETGGRDTAQQASAADWGEMFNKFWSPLLNQWSGLLKASGTQESLQFKGRVGESIQASTKMWHAMLGAASDPAALEHFQKATQITPDIALGFAQTCLQSFTNLQAQAGEWIEKRSAAISQADIQELDKEIIHKWSEAYEKEFSQYLKLPQIGMGRFYQERLLQATDKMNVLQAALSGFLQMLAQPVEQSLKTLQEKMAQMTEEGPLDDKAKTYYNLWIKLLEGHYMTLFKQSEYSAAMARTLEALNEYVEARQAVVNDLLKQFNVPTHQDLDDLYKEIYLLKKRMRAYEKRDSGF